MSAYKNTDKIISHLNDEIEACGNPDGNNEPITYGTMLGLLSAKAFIETAETADVLEVRHGKWIWFEDAIDWGLGAWICSECHGRNENIGAGKPGYDNSIGKNPYIWAGSKFCPNCGAKMDEEE